MTVISTASDPKTEQGCAHEDGSTTEPVTKDGVPREQATRTTVAEDERPGGSSKVEGSFLTDTTQLLSLSPIGKEDDPPFSSSLSPIKKLNDQDALDGAATAPQSNIHEKTCDTTRLEFSMSLLDSQAPSQLFHKDLEALGLLEDKSDDEDLNNSLNTNHTGRSSVFEPCKLYDDIYGLIYFANMKNQAFYFALVICFIQSSLLLLIFFDMVQVGLFESIDETNGLKNRIDLPVAVPVSVNVAQFFGIVLSVMMVASEGDLTRSLTKFSEGFNEDILLDDPDATYGSWLLGAVLQTFVGIVLAADLFVLLVQSRTVLEVCLNFAALHFVQEIDDVAFAVARAGFITQSIQDECKIVERYKTLEKPLERTVTVRRGLLLVVLVGYLIPYFCLLYWQWSGYYLCKTLYIQFDDSFQADLEAFSGIFESEGNRPVEWIEQRMVYYDETETIRLSYCSSEKAWIFSYEKDDSPCETFFMKSSRSEDSFDVIEIAGQPWAFHDWETGEESAVGWLSLGCNDCDKNKQLCKSSHGQCINRKCECMDGRMGVNCEYAEPTCGSLYMDVDTRASMAHVPGASVFQESEYVQLRANEINNWAVKISHHPIYVTKEMGDSTNFAAMVFSGRRWVLFGKLPEEFSALTPSDVYGRLVQIVLRKKTVISVLKTIQQELRPYKPLFFSSPINHGTTKEVVEPTNLDWVLSRRDSDSLSVLAYRADDQKPVSARFLCSDCDNRINVFFNSGNCNADTRKCLCYPSYYGPLCESAYTCREKGCIHGGTCDLASNTCKNCPKPFYGSLCQYDTTFHSNSTMDPFYCQRTTCQNGGECNPFLSQCDCPLLHTGEFCEILKEAGTIYTIIP